MTDLPPTAVRLRWLLDVTDGSQEDLAEAVDATQGAISLILVGKTRNSRLLPKIANAMNVNLNWLVGLTDELIWLYDEDGQEISEDELARIRSGKSDRKLMKPNKAQLWLPENKRSSNVTEHRLSFNAEPSPSDAAERLNSVLIPQLEIGYSMGGGSVFDDYQESAQVPFPRDWLAPMIRGSFADVFVARGDGDSMVPTLLDGDLVIVDTAQKNITQQDRLWCLSYGDLGMIKRVRVLPDGGVQINSDNPAVTPITAYDEEMHVIGRVIWIARRV